MEQEVKNGVLEKVAKKLVNHGDHRALDRVECAFDWEVSWARTVSAVWWFMTNIQNKAELNSEDTQTLTKIILESKISNYDNFIQEVKDAIEKHNGKVNTAFLDGQNTFKNSIEFDIDSSMTVLQGIVNYFGYDSSKWMKFSFEFANESVEYKVHPREKEDEIKIEGVVLRKAGHFYQNGWVNKEGTGIQEGLRFNVTAIIPPLPKDESLQAIALTDYQTSGISVPFTS